MGTKPCSRVHSQSGGKGQSPLKLKALKLLNTQRKSQICLFLSLTKKLPRLTSNLTTQLAYFTSKSVCLEQGADWHTAQLMPLPLTVSCFSKIQIGFTFLVPAHPGSPGQRAVKRVCVCLLLWICYSYSSMSLDSSQGLYMPVSCPSTW